MTSPHVVRAHGATTAALSGRQLGSVTLLFVMLSADAVLTVVAGLIPVGYASTGIATLPLALVLVGLCWCRRDVPRTRRREPSGECPGGY